MVFQPESRTVPSRHCLGAGAIRALAAGTLAGLFGLALAGCSIPMGSLMPDAQGTNGQATGSVEQSGRAAAIDQEGREPIGNFGRFVDALWPAAQQKGVSRKTFDIAFKGVTPDPKVIELTRRQAEFAKPLSEYLANAVSGQRLDRGQRVVREHAAILASVERAYGVDRTVVAGVWGMETNFGSTFGNNYVIRALATLAYHRYRGDYFRNELLTALTILEEGHVEASRMQGSWAGAMGHTQFMPTSFTRLAVDFDGDGRRDIWGSIPDALGSTANYLRKNGWQPGLPWGFEVKAPAGIAAGAAYRSFASWAALGVRRRDGKPMPAQGEAMLFTPSGSSGPAFLLTHNFAVIKRYNNSTAYALAVGHLGDRVYGGAPLQTSWPVAAAQ